MPPAILRLLTLHCFCLLCWAASILPALAATGANITETVAKTYYVNNQHASASDANAGTSNSLPLLTIKAAIEKAKVDLVAGTATKISIFPGTYREATTFIGPNSNANFISTLLVIEGTERGKVIVLGSDSKPISGWTALTNGVYSLPWSNNWGTLTQQWWDGFGTWMPPEVYRSELVVINGVPQTQKMLEAWTWNDPDGRNGAAGSWFVDPAGYKGPAGLTHPETFGVVEFSSTPATEADRLYIRPAGGINLSAAQIEVGMRAIACQIRDKNNLVIRNITFANFASNIQYAPLDISAADRNSNVLIEGCEFLVNGGIGLALNRSDNATVRRCVFRDNGWKSISSTLCSNVVIEDCDISGNNRRGAVGLVDSVDTAGIKAFDARDFQLTRLTGVDNFSGAIWFDYDNASIAIDDSHFTGGLQFGAYFEASPGPFALRDSSFSSFSLGGVLMAESQNAQGVWFEGNRSR